MSDDAGAGAPENGGQGTDTTAGAGGTGAGTATVDTSQAADWNATDWKAFADEVGLSPEQVRKKLGHARTWEERATKNVDAAKKLPTLEQQLQQLQGQMSERDARDVDRAGRMALTQIRSGLAEAGIRTDEVKDLLAEIDTKRLLKDGEPDDEAVNRIVTALSRTAGRPTPDPDQGARGGDGPSDMNSLMRSKLRARR